MLEGLLKSSKYGQESCEVADHMNLNSTIEH
jgi:hypothetical protein